MPAFSARAAALTLAALAASALFANTVAASEQSLHKQAHHKAHVAAPVSPIAPGVDLGSSTSAPVGSESHYFTDTVAAGYTDLQDQSFRYGQSGFRYNSVDPLFRF